MSILNIYTNAFTDSCKLSEINNTCPVSCFHDLDVLSLQTFRHFAIHHAVIRIILMILNLQMNPFFLGADRILFHLDFELNFMILQ